MKLSRAMAVLRSVDREKPIPVFRGLHVRRRDISERHYSSPPRSPSIAAASRAVLSSMSGTWGGAS
ncbi:MAG: hypothetical protein AAF982_09375, partial [Pseudomonadota bacterium]